MLGKRRAVNASSFSARAEGLNSFRFGSGPVRRFVAGPRKVRGDLKMRSVNVIPGGPSENPFSPNYATQLAVWLTADYHDVKMGKNIPGKDTQTDETFVPAP